MADNSVQQPPDGLVLAIQYWGGDEARAMRLARLLADIEPQRRDDVILAFCRRSDMPVESEEAWKTRLHCGHKFTVTSVLSRREGTGHPHGCNQLWSAVMDHFSEAWRAGRLSAHSVFSLEADGVPLRDDWIDVVKAEHERTLEARLRVTGSLMNRVRHINGSLIAHLSMWFDHASLRNTPSMQAWDCFHAQVLTSEARPTEWIKNIYGAGKWSSESLEALAKETAWLSSSKDDSALAWAERTLVPRAAPSGPMSCSCPEPSDCARSACPCPCVCCSGAPSRRRRVAG